MGQWRVGLNGEKTAVGVGVVVIGGVVVSSSVAATAANAAWLALLVVSVGIRRRLRRYSTTSRWLTAAHLRNYRLLLV